MPRPEHPSRRPGWGEVATLVEALTKSRSPCLPGGGGHCVLGRVAPFASCRIVEACLAWAARVPPRSDAFTTTTRLTLAATLVWARPPGEFEIWVRNSSNRRVQSIADTYPRDGAIATIRLSERKNGAEMFHGIADGESLLSEARYTTEVVSWPLPITSKSFAYDLAY